MGAAERKRRGSGLAGGRGGGLGLPRLPAGAAALRVGAGAVLRGQSGAGGCTSLPPNRGAAARWMLARGQQLRMERLLATQFAMHLEEIESRESDSELSRFLKDTCEKNTEDFEILTWWKVNSNKYPILSKLAKDVLAVPVSTVASESAFSTGGRVISSFRSSLSPKMAEVLICAQSWLRSSPKKLDMREIIKDLQNCEALEEEFADLNSGDLNSFSSMDTRSYPLMGWQSHGAAVSTCFLSIAADQFKFPDVKTSLAYDGPPAVGSMPQLYQEDASIKPSMGFAHCIAVSLQKHILQFVPIFGDIGD
ncbi:hypothetical protein ACP70R_021143 [Stipagrostis hirtigluma subsp. patula]